MIVHRSNRAERLLDALVEVVRSPAGDPFEPECVVVQGRGMERWLAMELASRLGVWANADFPFPRRLIARALAAAPEAGGADAGAFEPERMLWSIRAILPELCHRHPPEFESIRSYLDGDERGVRAIQLAHRIAETFDHYAVHRPEMVLAWEGEAGASRASRALPAVDDSAAWQPILWRALVAHHGPGHVGARTRAFLSAAERGALELDGFPRRVSLFGISTLPPLYVRILAALARFVEVHIFSLSPSREFWALVRSRRDLLRRAKQAGMTLQELEQELHYEVGHPLLASLGRLGRDFQGVLEGEAVYRDADADLYFDPGTGSMLRALQSDMLALRRRPADEPRLPFDARDESIRIHACHSPLREVEVLHDQLLAIFEADPSLEPRDVVVMTPAIETYAPAVEAVFGAGAGGAPRIPYSLADRGPRAADELIDAFERVLDVLVGRLSANDVVDLLGVPAVRQRFEIAPEDLEELRRWIDRAAIRWGADRAHREEEGLPPISQNSWRFGLDRLLLGYALDDEDALFAGVRPCGEVEGSAADLLDSLLAVADALFRLRGRLREPRPLEEWAVELSAVLEETLAVGSETADQARRLREGLATLAERARNADFEEPVSLEVVRDELARELRRRTSARGFLTSGVCFCELVPMRTIPFRVVCLLGMSDEAFPRSERPPGFDLMARHAALGDRSLREDDRYLFLEAVLAARERLIITYVGRSIRDNRPLPPSVVVSELLEAIEETYEVAPADLRRRIEVVHPLQAFSPRYFDGEDERLFGFRREACEAARALMAAPREPEPFAARPLPGPEPPAEVALEELIRFFRNPPEAFGRRILGLALEREDPALESRIPLRPQGLERWALGDLSLQGRLHGMKPEDLVARLAAAGLLPPGSLGQVALRAIAEDVDRIAAAAATLRQGNPLRPVEIDVVVGDIRVGDLRVTGLIRDLWPAGLVRVGFARAYGPGDIEAWIRHLFLNLARPPGASLHSYLLRRPEKDHAPRSALHRIDEVEPRFASACAAALLRFYTQGQRSPLPFFPKPSWKYARACIKANNEEGARKALADVRAEAEKHGGLDPWARTVFRGRDPLAERDPAPEHRGPPPFPEVSLEVLSPLLGQLVEIHA